MALTRNELIGTLKTLIKEKDIVRLSKALFGFEPTKRQADIIRVIAFREHKRVIVNCHTRYGKTQATAIGVGIFLILNTNKKVYVVSATDEQANLLRNYLADALVQCAFLRDLVTKSKGTIERMREEMSRKRMTFRNGNQLITISAQGEANRLMGHGGDLVVLDESCLIKPEVYRSKISRMLGDSPDSALVELSNPWTRDSHYYDHWTSPRFKTIHVGWQEGLEEGRITQEFVDEQREQLTKAEFTVLYESDFPAESEDSVFSFDWIQRAMDLWDEIKDKGLQGYDERRVSCDVADKGLDWTVILDGERKQNEYFIRGVFAESKSENVQVGARILRISEEQSASAAFIDAIGVGAGVLSYVRSNPLHSRYRVVGCHFGAKPRNSKRFLNRKAEAYWRLRELMRDGLVAFPRDERFVRDLLGVRWEFSGAQKIRIVDPDKSPDFGDALVYFVWDEGGREWGIG